MNSANTVIFQMNLTETEALFRQMYERHPQLHLDLPRSLDELTQVTSTLAEPKQLAEQAHRIPVSSTLQENQFPGKADVVVNRHERYSPCFFHAHDFFEISYVLCGSCTNYMPGQTLHMKTGSLSLMSLHTPHAISVFNDDTVVINIMLKSSTFRQAFFGTLTQKDVISSFFSRALYTTDTEAYLLFETGDDPSIRSLICEIYQESQTQQNYAERMLNVLVTELFIHLLRRHQQHLTIPNPSGHTPDNNIIFILNYMLHHSESLSLKDLSSFFGYSERQMSRILKDYTGKSFTSIVQDIRMQKACELLCSTQIPITEIAETVGYHNLNHFYTVFKKEYQMTPAAYRERSRYSPIP